MATKTKKLTTVRAVKKNPGRVKLEKEIRRATAKNRKITLLTPGQVRKFWKITADELKNVPVAAVFDGKPYYTEYQVDIATFSKISLSPEENIAAAVQTGVLDRPVSDFWPVRSPKSLRE